MNIKILLFLQLCYLVTFSYGKGLHAAFKGAGKSGGLEIWRIESFEPVPWKKSDYGTFFEGDSYIILSTKEEKDGDKVTYSWDIHFWLGKDTTQDEFGSAAILSVDLDDTLGGKAVQHREVQDYESEQFLSYFSAGVRYLPGGVKSGFKHVQINAPGETRLYQVKGQKTARVRLVELSVKSLNNGDCFILDAGNNIYVYVGTQAKTNKRIKAIKAANQIRDQDHHGRAKVMVIDSSSSNNEIRDFFKALGSGSPSEVANGSGDDEEFDKKQNEIVVLYKVTSTNGKIISEKISDKPLKQSMLKSGGCYILDTGTSGIFVWIGQGSPKEEKVEAFKRGQAFIKEKNYPAWTHMHRIVEHAEPTAFKEYFDGWKDA
uniref:Venom gelsolin 1 n=1 Tax=Ectomocoris sp. TaxID=3104572 RepID=A0AB38ZE59_9HEMI